MGRGRLALGESEKTAIKTMKFTGRKRLKKILLKGVDSIERF